jgi:hypothetical protein
MINYRLVPSCNISLLRLVWWIIEGYLVNYYQFYYLFYYGLDFGKTVKFWVFEKITSLVQKHIGLWNTPLDKCIK